MISDRESNLSRSFARKSSFSAQSPKNRLNYDNRQLDSIICGSHASYYILDLINHGIQESELHKLSIISSVDLTLQQLIHVQDFLQQKCDHSNDHIMVDSEPPSQKIENFSNYAVQLQIREQAPISMVDQQMAKQYSQFGTTIVQKLITISSKIKESQVKLMETSSNETPPKSIIYVPLENMELQAPSENELEQDIFYRKIHQQKVDVQYQKEKIKILLKEKDNKAKQALALVSKDDKKFTYDYDSSIILVKENSNKLPNISLLPTSKIIHSQIFQEQTNKPEIIQLNLVKKQIAQVNRPSLNMQMDFEVKRPKIHNDIIRVEYQNQQFDHIIQQDYIKVLEDTKTRLSKKQLQDIIDQQNYSVKVQKRYSYDTNNDQDVTNQKINNSNKHQLKSIMNQKSQNINYPSNLQDSGIKENKRATSVSYGQIKYQSLNNQQYKGFIEISPNETISYIKPETSKKQRNLTNLSNDRIVVNKEDNSKFLVSRQSGTQQPLLPLIKKIDRAESRCRSRQQNRTNIEKQNTSFYNRSKQIIEFL